MRMRDATIDWIASMSTRRGVELGIVAPRGSRSPTVTVVKLPAGMKGPEVTEAVKARGITVGGGYGQLKDTTIRIGHMGDHTLDGIQRCLHICESVITELAERRQLVRI